MIRVFLIRHGESESNAGLPSADPGSAPLTPDGHRQARQIARVLPDVPALIVTSPYLRARQTAQPTISRFPATACQEWPVQEFTYLGDLHGRTSTAAERQPWARAYWDQADPHHASPGAESFTDLLQRTAGFLDRLGALRSGPVVVFTHGLFMRAVAWSLLTGITTPGQDQMRSFRRFASQLPDPQRRRHRTTPGRQRRPCPPGRLHHSPARRPDTAAAMRRMAIIAADPDGFSYQTDLAPRQTPAAGCGAFPPEMRAAPSVALGSRHPGVFRACEFAVGAGINEKTGRLRRYISGRRRHH